MIVLKDLAPFIGMFVTMFCFSMIYWRESRKQFQDKIFEYKFTAYKEIITELGSHHDTLSALQQTLQNYEGTAEEWVKHFQETCGEWYEPAYELDKLMHRHGLILPNKSLEKLIEIAQTGVLAVTVHFHFDNEIAINAVDKFWQLYMAFIEVARKDLKIDKLNTTLSERLTHPLYPIKSPFNIGAKSQDAADKNQ